ncbi:MAG: plasmid stabilization system [Alphaproteobacteria bacterium]|nr:MAG: plasmid stabilization system [Alphaproteobacteria bacterium]
MRKYRVEIKPTAEADLIKRYHEIGEGSPQNALNWYLSIIDAIEKLDELAERCPIAPEDREFNQGIRHLIIGDYRALYHIVGDAVEILHIRHSAIDRKL